MLRVLVQPASAPMEQRQSTIAITAAAILTKTDFFIFRPPSIVFSLCRASLLIDADSVDYEQHDKHDEEDYS